MARVRTALASVPGVRSVEVRYEEKEAVVVLDDASVRTEDLVEALRRDGMDGHVKEGT